MYPHHHDDAENDHIEEFDHAHPSRGEGPTSLDNLHRLHWVTTTSRQPDG